MKNLFLPFATVLAFFTVASCSSQKSNDSAASNQEVTAVNDTIPYTVVNNYFINNNVDSVPEVITSDAEFKKCFGMAAYMGDGGTPTAIDFAKQIVIVASVPSTDFETKITPVSLKKEDDTLVFTCKLAQGAKQTYTTHPFVMIAVDKRYESPVTVKKI